MHSKGELRQFFFFVIGLSQCGFSLALVMNGLLNGRTAAGQNARESVLFNRGGSLVKCFGQFSRYLLGCHGFVTVQGHKLQASWVLDK